jgi:ADP-heptose:LPS heptosyltransferase
MCFCLGNGKYETDILKVWENAYPNVLGCYNLGSLEMELEIISNLNAMVSMDSANGHIAANYNVPVISLWGPYPSFWRIWLLFCLIQKTC